MQCSKEEVTEPLYKLCLITYSSYVAMSVASINFHIMHCLIEV